MTLFRRDGLLQAPQCQRSQFGQSAADGSAVGGDHYVAIPLSHGIGIKKTSRLERA